ncbi:MAG TPA: ATP-binding cassette domain-containing protein [Acidimicrobiales bacterium]|nr:ATP-binding cassette domain-containing protein [Acidimicrobiales bacterium]
MNFDIPPEIIALGLITGLTYSLLGIGLTLVYRSSRVINFAHGDMGSLPAGILLVLVINLHWPYLPALAVALAAAVAIGGLVEFLVIRRLTEAPRLVVLVSTIGVAQLLLAINSFIPREDLGSSTFPTPFDVHVDIGTLRLGTGELMILVVVPIVAAVLALWYTRSRVGLASRAAADNLEAARLAGARVRRVSVTTWVIVALLAATSAILVGPTKPITASLSLGPALMVRALAAAMIGGLTSLPQVFAGGIAIGLIELLVSWNYPSGGVLELTLLAVVLVSMLVRSDLGRLARGAQDSAWALGESLKALDPTLARLPRVRMARAGASAALIAVAIALPVPLDSGQTVLLSSVVLYALMGLSLVVLTGFGGQVSLGQFAFVGLGAVVGGRAFQLGYPAWMAVSYVMAAGAVLAVLVGLPALRLRGLFLAISTLTFALAADSWLLRQEWLVVVRDGRTSLELPRPTWFGFRFQSELTYYWLCLAVLLVCIWLVHRLRRSGVGRSLMATRDNEPAAASLSVPPRRVKLTAFALSGMLASVAGYFYGGLLVNFTEASLFAPERSLALVGMVIFGGVTTITGAVIGALWIRGIPYLLGQNFGLLSSGLGVIVVLQILPGGLASLLFRIRDRAARWLAGEAFEAPPANAADHVVRTGLPAKAVGVADAGVNGVVDAIKADAVTVTYGGVVAVDGATVTAHQGEIVGLVGPNGAGKTTLFDVLSGQTRPSVGRVILLGRDVTALPPEKRALAGLGRSFQDARLFPDLSIIDTFALALERHDPAEVVPSLLDLPPARRSERWKQASAGEIVELLGLTPFANRTGSELSTGTRRLAELGCLVAMGCDVLLLDEPTAGLAQREVEAFTPVLREIRDHLDATMIVIDHDIPMVMGLVDRLYVMSAGTVIAEGAPRLLREDPAVIAAYLGTDERAIHRSGAVSAGRPAGKG